jgi:hypothetical protein
MQIPPQALKVTLAMPASQVPAWRPGQVIEAVVIRTDPARQQTEVRIGNLHLTLHLHAGTVEGSRLTLQVVSGGARPVLTLLGQSAPLPGAPGLSSPAASASAGWLSGLLPAQGRQTPLLASLAWLTGKPGRMAALPAPVRGAVEQAMHRMPTPDQVSRAQGLREAVKASGLFHEASLALLAANAAGASSAPAANLKSVLLSLAARLRAHTGGPQALSPARPLEVPPPRPGTSPTAQQRVEANLARLECHELMQTLRARAESALARLVLHQWSTMECADAGHPRWLVELPLRSGDGVDLVHLLMEKAPQRPALDEEPTWRAELALDLPELGSLHIHVSVSGDQVNTRFWAESEASVDRIRAALPRLHDALAGRDLTVRNLGCAPGTPPTHRDAPSAGPLLDDRA